MTTEPMGATPDIPKMMEALRDAQAEARHAEYREYYSENRSDRDRAAGSRAHYESKARRIRQEILDLCEEIPAWEQHVAGAAIRNPDLSELAAELREAGAIYLSRSDQ